MKAPSPAFSFYPKDILSDAHCASMTDEELGVYVRLLCHAWLEGSIPADPVKLQRLTKRRPMSFARVWTAIQPCWEQRGDRLVQRRLEQERVKQQVNSSTQAHRAHKGWKSRRINKTDMPDESPMKAQRKPNACLPSPSPSPSPSPQRTDFPAAPDVVPRGTELKLTPPPTMKPRRKNPSWSGQLCDVWSEIMGGTAPGGEIGRYCGALRTRELAHGTEAEIDQEMQTRLRRYLHDELGRNHGRYVSAKRFCETYAAWAEHLTAGALLLIEAMDSETRGE